MAVLLHLVVTLLLFEGLSVHSAAQFLLVADSLVLDPRHPLRELAGGQGLFGTRIHGVDGGNEECLAVATETVAQHRGQHRVAVWNVGAPVLDFPVQGSHYRM